MTREFEAGKTAAFFNTVYSKADSAIVASDESRRLHPRDHILMHHVLEGLPKSTRLLDYGCGQGRLVHHLLDSDWDARGMEKHPGMRDVGVAEIGDPDRILLGGIDELEQMETGSVDLFVAMGVFQYVAPEEYARTLKAVNRLLSPGGHYVATYQNAFFDLFTFNKYTIDYMANELIGRHVADADRAKVADALSGLVTNPGKPGHSESRARDNIYVRLTNPLTIGDELAVAGLGHTVKHFYDFFGLPPLVASALPELSKQVADGFEVDNATAWEGHFMANAFLVHARKDG